MREILEVFRPTRLYGADGVDDEPGQEPSSGDDQESTLDDAAALEVARKAREEAAARRVAYQQEKKRADELAARLKEYEDREKTEVERAREQAESASSNLAALESQLRNERTNNAIITAASGMNFHDLGDASALIDRSRIEYDEDGRPSNKSVKAALEALAKSKPHLIGADKKDPGSADGAARGGDATKKTWEQLVKERTEKMVAETPDMVRR